MECPAPWYELLDQAGASALVSAVLLLWGIAFVFRTLIRFVRGFM